MITELTRSILVPATAAEPRNMVFGSKIEATPVVRADAYDVFERHWMRLIEAIRSPLPASASRE